MKENTIDRLIGDSAIIVLLLTGLLFLSTYTVQVGYCSYYRIPKSLIVVDGNLISDWFQTIGYQFMYVALFESFIARQLFPFFEKYPSIVFSEQYSLYVWIIFIVLNVIICFTLKANWFFLLVFCGFLILLCIVFFRNHMKFKKGTFIVNSSDNSDEELNMYRYSIFRRLFGEKILPLLLITFFFVSISSGYGEQLGRNQNSFYQVNGRTDIIGVHIYGDYLIAKAINDNTLAYNEIINMSDCVSLVTYENEEYKQLVALFHDSKKKSKEIEVNEIKEEKDNIITAEQSE